MNPYHDWLEIDGDRQANHYQLLGIDLFENDREVIEAAFRRHFAKVRMFQVGPHGDLALRVLEELSAAFLCLTNDRKKADYDDQLLHRRHQIDSHAIEGELLVSDVPDTAQTPLPAESNSLPVQDDANAWFYLFSDHIFGPLEWDVVNELAFSGMLRRDTMLHYDGTWRPLKSYESLRIAMADGTAWRYAKAEKKSKLTGQSHTLPVQDAPNAWFYVRPGLFSDHVVGPLEWDEIYELAYSGKLKPDTIVHYNGSWGTLESHELLRIAMAEGVAWRHAQVEKKIELKRRAKVRIRSRRLLEKAREEERREAVSAAAREYREAEERAIAIAQQENGQTQAPPTDTPGLGIVWVIVFIVVWFWFISLF